MLKDCWLYKKGPQLAGYKLPCLKNTIHIPKAINDKVEMTDTHVLTFRMPMNSGATVSKMPEVELGSPQVATSQPAASSAPPQGSQVNW